MMGRTRSIPRRVDAGVWKRLEEIFPNESSATISRMLWRSSPLRLESGLRNLDRQLEGRLNARKKKR